MAELHTVIVSLKSGLDLRGVLREEADNALVLTSAAVAGTVNERLVWRPLVGEVVIPLSNVDYWQRSLPIEVLDSLAS
jgi:hypothetical protein